MARTNESLSTAIIRREEVEEAPSRCFPCTIVCCPCLPTSLTKVQDWLHLVLILGVVASTACVVQMVYEFAVGDDWKQVFSGVLLIPSSIYFIKTIGSYDEQLREKKARHREEVENLIHVINTQVAEMNELCSKITENANEFALGRFNDKCEQFRRFLESIMAHYEDLYVSADMLKELRSFVHQWLRVFSGTLLNPQNSPLVKDLDRELERCQTAREICNAALRRIKESRVALQFQAPAETPMMTGRSFVTSHVSSMADEAGARTVAYPEGRCGVTWLRCGRYSGVRCEWSPTPDRMPVKMQVGCCKLRVLSRQHANLLVAFFMDIVLVILEACFTRWASFLLVVANEICVVSVLACFEQINEIAMLERQILAYNQRSEEVKTKKDEAMRSWEKVQELHDLWLYRTLPSLAIMGKIHNHLADIDMGLRRDLAEGGRDSRPGFLSLANQSMEVLQAHLGTLEDWTNKGRRDVEWRDKIGSQLKGLERESDLSKILGSLPYVAKLDLTNPDVVEALPQLSADVMGGSRRTTPRSSPVQSPRNSGSSASASANGHGSPEAAERQAAGSFTAGGGSKASWLRKG